MTRKFEVTFTKATSLKPSMVYVSADARYPGHFNASVLHCAAKSGAWQQGSVRLNEFDLKQNLLPTEQEAIDWAKQWLTIESGADVSLKELP
jgi:hypothetical protein